MSQNRLTLFLLCLTLILSYPFDENNSILEAENNNNVQDKSQDCGCASGLLNRDTLQFVPNKTLHTLSGSSSLSSSSSDSIIEENLNSNSPNMYNEVNKYMAYIPGGTFLMGLKKAIFPRDGESPQRYVAVSPFFIDKYEVSNEQFNQFIKATKFRTESEIFGWSFAFEPAVPPEVKAPITQAVLGAEWWLPVNGSYWREPEGPGTDVFFTNRSNYPVVQVSWNDAVEFCSWRGARLPTEAEWEYAAQGTGRGKTTIFPWGNKLMPSGIHRTNIYQGLFPNQATPQDGHEFHAPIDSYGSQNEYGLYNMIGNVWEWVDDWFTTDHGSYLKTNGTKQSPVINPRGPPSGRDKVKKGGSFLCHESYCYRYRTAARFYSTPDSGALNSGFRCARDIPEESTSAVTSGNSIEDQNEEL